MKKGNQTLPDVLAVGKYSMEYPERDHIELENYQKQKDGQIDHMVVIIAQNA